MNSLSVWYFRRKAVVDAVENLMSEKEMSLDRAIEEAEKERVIVKQAKMTIFSMDKFSTLKYKG